ncbi:SGNH/GDSL hydrolase family protein [Paenibacillus sp. NPDC093718]|uniref:SGNH/GDSL hydrolase family protein n=1 Tax=Paenibacillus sp. NPDC093718 TaxID=3390601 RepID=UPI003D0048D0
MEVIQPNIMKTGAAIAESGNRWLGTWFASQTYYDARFAAIETLESQTIRMIVNAHTAGSTLRLKLSNLYGSEPVLFGSVNVALTHKDGHTVPGSNRHVTIEGNATTIIPAGQEIYTDPVALNVSGAVDVAISIYVPKPAKTSTWHFSPPQSTYIADGDHASDSSADFFKRKTHSCYWISGIEVLSQGRDSRVIVALGDSITEGSTSTAGSNHRWPDFFYDRLVREEPDREISVLNSGIVGNQILKSGPDIGLPVAGENVLSRLDRDVFSHPGITDVIFFEGINDIGSGNATADQIVAGMMEVAIQAQTKGVRIYIGTLTPFGNAAYYSEEKERVRQEVNQWIRTQHVFNGMFDFDKALANPEAPNELLPAYDYGDHLHLSDAGYKALADCVPLSLFKG